jgi:hypothetical protein
MTANDQSTNGSPGAADNLENLLGVESAVEAARSGVAESAQSLVRLDALSDEYSDYGNPITGSDQHNRLNSSGFAQEQLCSNRLGR